MLTKFSKLDVQEFDKVMHLTNNAIQKKCPGYSEMKEDSIWSMARFSVSYFDEVMDAN